MSANRPSPADGGYSSLGPRAATTVRLDNGTVLAPHVSRGMDGMAGATEPRRIVPPRV